jgi:DNA-binding MarR family transcriptional regulator
MTPGKLAELTGLTTGDITVVLDRLEKAKYIRQDRNPNDRRSILIVVTPEKNRAHLHAAYSEITKESWEKISKFSNNELEIITKFFEQIKDIRMDSKYLPSHKSKT